MAIKRIQGSTRGTADGAVNTLQVTLTSTPTQSNLLILTIGIFDYFTLNTVTSITQTNVTWTKQTQKQAYDQYDSEIWAGVVGSNPSTSITVNFTGIGNRGLAIADVCEYSGIQTSRFLDKTSGGASNQSQSGNTGTTAITTRPQELWIGEVFHVTDFFSDSTQNSPTNSFTLLDGVGFDAGNGYHASCAYLEKIVSTTGTANTGTSFVASGYWVGCIATFKGEIPPYTISAIADSHSAISPAGNVTVISGEDQTFNIIVDSGYRPGWVQVKAKQCEWH